MREDDPSWRRKLGYSSRGDGRVEVRVGFPGSEEELDPVVIKLRREGPKRRGQI